MVINSEVEKEQKRLRKEISDDDWETLGVFGEVPRVLAVYWNLTKKEVICELQGGKFDGRLFRPEFNKTPRDELQALGSTLLYISSSIPIVLFT